MSESVPLRRFSAVALDLDGTMLSRTSQIPPENIAAVREAAELGVQIIIATGRMTPAVLPHAKTLNLPDLVMVTYNGAAGMTKDGTLLFHRPLSASICNKVLNYCERTTRCVNIYVDDQLFAGDKPQFAPYIFAYQVLSGIKATTVASYDQFRGREPTKLLVFCEQSEHIVQKLYEEMQQLLKDDSVHLIRADFFVEILLKGVNKGNGLERLAKHLNIPMDEIVAIGDAENDIEFLKGCGYGIAVANAHELAKKAAKKVSEFTNDQAAVGKEIRLLLSLDIPKGPLRQRQSE